MGFLDRLLGRFTSQPHPSGPYAGTQGDDPALDPGTDHVADLGPHHSTDQGARVMQVGDDTSGF